MAKIINALREIGKKCNASGTVPTGKSVSDVLNSIASNFNINGEKGDDGASVTAIALVTESGNVVSGTATLSDGTTVEIAISEAPVQSGQE